MAAGARHILAIDLGTSALKVALVSARGDVVASRQAACRADVLPGGGAEQDPRRWWSLIASAATALMSGGPVPPESVASVSCTAQWSGTVAAGERGEPLRPAIIWMDSRGAPQVARLVRGPLPVRGYGLLRLSRWIHTTGGAPARSGKDSLAHILWLRDAEPETYRRARWFLEPKDWVNLRLTGRAAASHDSIALHWVTDNRDPARVRYDPALLRLTGLDRAQLPDLLPAAEILGPLLPGPARELGVPPGVPVVAGAPDMQSAAIGSGATRDFQAHLYVGTSSWLTCHVPFQRTNVLRNIAALPSAIPGRYFLAAEQETAGAALRFLAEGVLGGAGGHAELDAMAARAAPGSGGVIFTPWLYGERSPVEDRHVRGGFHNLSLSTTREDLARSVLEGVALNTRWLLESAERLLRRRLDPIRCIGGGARSGLWRQIFADVLGRAVEQVADPVNANARGAAMIAAVALGDMTFGEAPERVAVVRRHEPRETAHRLYSDVFREFVGLYRRNRRAYARLNRGTGSAAGEGAAWDG